MFFLIAAAVTALTTLTPFTIATSPSSASSPNTFCWDRTKSLLVFGDSYTFIQGHPHGHDNYSFIGDALDYEFTPQMLKESEIVANWTSAGGPNWVEYLTNCFSGPPAKCKKQLWDFAFAGADISAKYLTLHHNYTIDLDDQVKQWDLYGRKTIDEIGKVKKEDTLVAFFIGINDINDSAKWKNVTFSDFYDEIVGEYFRAVDLVYSRGFRHFLFLGLPPLDKTESNLKATTPLPNRTMISQYDISVRTHAESFQRAHPKTTVQVFDTYSALNEVLENPQDYGITNTTHWCRAYQTPELWNEMGCSSEIGEYFWYNSGHITYTTQQILAKKLEKQLRGASRC